ncbi:MAG: hypothetical protein WHS89_02795 [Acidimicrobiales bacterium]
MTDDSIWLHTADGLSLEAEVRLPEGATASVVLAHPHPLHGGSMRSVVTSELFRLLPSAGLAALRFNFRGVERSEGTHGGGVDEALDLVAAIDALDAIGAPSPYVITGWSFGGDVSLSVIDGRVDGWTPIAPPLRVLPPDALLAAHDPRPKYLIVPERDQFRPPAAAAEATKDWVNTTIEVVAGADHFLLGRTDVVASLVIEHVRHVTRDPR